ncbi:MAG: amino acid--tRNA ligase-related protein [Microgenomates group bacterium]
MRIKTYIQNKHNHFIYQSCKKAVREFLEDRGYVEVDLPVLSPALIPESYLEVFETEFYFLDKKEKLYLTPSPELFLKRLLVEGVSNCFYFGKSFRNSEPSSSLHCHEFEILEMYKVGVDYLQLADEVLEMVKYIDKKIQNLNPAAREQRGNFKSQNLFKKLKINFNRWEKIKVSEAFEKFAGVTEKELFSHHLFLKKAEKKGYNTSGFAYEDIWSQIYTQEIEPHLGINGYPTLIYDYPKEFAALAKLNDDGKTAQRFEFYINGIELGDCYTELSDWQQQEGRFLLENKKRKESGKINHPIDKGFIEALKYNLPFCSGIAIGFERLVMVLLGLNSIKSLKLVNIEF